MKSLYANKSPTRVSQANSQVVLKYELGRLTKLPLDRIYASDLGEQRNLTDARQAYSSTQQPERNAPESRQSILSDKVNPTVISSMYQYAGA
jgi:hypothetical protein